MRNIFYIMGRSSSGKDSIYKQLLADNKLEFNQVILYTTRPMRQGEKDGREYYFVSDEEFEELRKKNKFIEIREYNTVRGIWKYATSIDSFKDDGNYLAIGTLESFMSLKKVFNVDLHDIYIHVNDDILMNRSILRAKGDKAQDIEEIKRRFESDSIDFRQDKIKEAGITNLFENNSSLEECVSKIKDYIIKVLGGIKHV